jgi:hypothetical protein
VKCADFVTQMDLHIAVASAYYSRLKLDPHIDPTGPLNPRHLVEKWVDGFNTILKAENVALVNSCGGILPPTNIRILSRLEIEKLRWPDSYDDEIITISRWPKGLHYYIASNKNRLFSPSKFNTYDEARDLALVYASPSRIKSRE